jgi:hypothetical protein
VRGVFRADDDGRDVALDLGEPARALRLHDRGARVVRADAELVARGEELVLFAERLPFSRGGHAGALGVLGGAAEAVRRKATTEREKKVLTSFDVQPFAVLEATA